MCAPFVIEGVRQELSRRGFIAAVAACGTVVATPAAAQQKPVPSSVQEEIVARVTGTSR